MLARGIVDCKSNIGDKSKRGFKRLRSTSTSNIMNNRIIINYNSSSIKFVIKILF